MNQRLVAPCAGKLIQALTRFPVVLACPIEMTGVSLRLEAGQERVHRCAHVANHGEIDRRAAPDGLRPQIDLSDPDPRTARIELSIGKVSP